MMNPITRLLAAMTLAIPAATTALAAPAGTSLPPQLEPAQKAIARGDLVSARIALNTILEETRRHSELARAARRLFDVELPLPHAEQRLAAAETFLVEDSLKAIERKLARPPKDAEARERISRIRQRITEVDAQLEREQPALAHAVRYLLSLHRIRTGHYPISDEEAGALLAPGLAQGTADFSLAGWTPLPGGYRAILLDRRSGKSFEITPD